MTSSSNKEPRKYRIDFALIILTGLLTRYLLLRPIVEKNLTIDARWCPIRTWIPNDFLRMLPGQIRLRLRHFLDSCRLYLARPVDAIVIHVFETYTIFALIHRLIRSKTVIVVNPDGELAASTAGPPWFASMSRG